MKPPKPIQVTNLDTSACGGALRAVCSVRVGQIVFHQVRLIEDPAGTFAVGGPQLRQDLPTGTRYQTLVAWPKLWRDAIRDAVLTAYQQGGQ